MALFANHLRRTLSHEQAPQLSVSDPIADLDGVSDGNPHGQQLHGPIFQQRPFGSSAPVPMNTKQFFAAGVNSGLQDYRPLDRQSTQQQVEARQSKPHSPAQTFENTVQQSSAHATAVEPSQGSPEHFQAPVYDQVPSIPHSAADTSEIQMKQEPEPEDDAVFRAFTHGDFHDEDGGINAEIHSVIDNTNGPVGQNPNDDISIKSEPQIGSETNNNTFERAPLVDCNIMPDQGALSAPAFAPHQTPPLWSDGRSFERNSTMFPNPSAFVGSANQHSIKAIPQDGVSTPQSFQTGIASDLAPGPSFESVHDPGQQSAGSLQRSAGPIEGLQQCSSAEAVLSLNDLDSMAIDTNSIAQQWQQRPQLSNAVSLTEDMIHINPRMLHGPMPISIQSDHLTRQLTNGVSTPFTNSSHIRRGSYNQPPNASHPRTNLAYSSNVPYQSHSWASQMNPQAHLIPLDFASRYPLPNMSTPNGSVTNPQIPVVTSNLYNHQVRVEAEDVEMSEDSVPVKARASRPRAEPTMFTLPPKASNSNGSIFRAQPLVSVPEVSMAGGNPDSIDPSSNDDDSDVEPISWKLPSFEAAFQEPQAPDDLPTARISIPNLVREHVVLTEDHCRQEMQLFLEVFLPAQQNLTEPDPEPAHAVLNFHTIAVMVLEAFVQWEIGDEMGRGYGFLGGNTAMRPAAPQGDEEPERIRSATDADVDDIFFTVVDRWRAGMLANKGTFKLIRGVQEFCEVALDVIHFVKEHGLLPPEQKKRKERSDKGTARGQKDDTKAKAAGAAKRKAEPEKKSKVNSLQARKKPKVGTTAPKKPAPRANTKAKTKTGKEAGVLVIPRKT